MAWPTDLSANWPLPWPSTWSPLDHARQAHRRGARRAAAVIDLVGRAGGGDAQQQRRDLAPGGGRADAVVAGVVARQGHAVQGDQLVVAHPLVGKVGAGDGQDRHLVLAHQAIDGQGLRRRHRRHGAAVIHLAQQRRLGRLADHQALGPDGGGGAGFGQLGFVVGGIGAGQHQTAHAHRLGHTGVSAVELARGLGRDHIARRHPGQGDAAQRGLGGAVIGLVLGTEGRHRQQPGVDARHHALGIELVAVDRRPVLVHDAGARTPQRQRLVAARLLVGGVPGAGDAVPADHALHAHFEARQVDAVAAVVAAPHRAADRQHRLLGEQEGTARLRHWRVGRGDAIGAEVRGQAAGAEEAALGVL